MSGEYVETRRTIPPGVSAVRSIRGKDWRFTTHRYVILFVTFIAYACYHAAKKPTSIVKSVLDPENVKNVTMLHHTWPVGEIFIKRDVIFEENGLMGSKVSHKEGWEPFNCVDGTSKLGEIDVAFLACYSMGMYVAGHLGDTLDLRLFLTSGMIGSGIFVALFGMGFFWNIHDFWFYLVMQMLGGLCQSTGWPSVVAVMGNWFGKRKRGLIMGIWNAHTSIGNISGSLLAAGVLDFGWGWSFIAPGALIIIGGIMVYLFLVPYPEDLGFPSPHSLNLEGSGAPNEAESPNLKENEKMQRSKVSRGQVEKTSSHNVSSANRHSVGLLEACLIPGVMTFALCLFFSKLVAYTFLYWLPFYLSQTAIDGQFMSVKSAGNLSTLFDIGGVVGGILAGYISDKTKARATTAATFVYAAIPAMLLYRSYGGISETWNIVLMMVVGLFVNGPYALITTAVSADLGTHSSISEDSRALATVAAIIDGTGSIGAALGPLLTGFLSTKGWDAVFAMLVACALAAGLLLTRLVIGELTEKPSKRRPGEQHNAGGNTPSHANSMSEPLLSEKGNEEIKLWNGLVRCDTRGNN